MDDEMYEVHLVHFIVLIHVTALYNPDDFLQSVPQSPWEESKTV